jgi:hypothetical protein
MGEVGNGSKGRLGSGGEGGDLVDGGGGVERGGRTIAGDCLVVGKMDGGVRRILEGLGEGMSRLEGRESYGIRQTKLRLGNLCSQNVELQDGDWRIDILYELLGK